MSDTELIGWLGNFAFICGAIGLAKKKPISCMILNIVGNAMYCWQAILMYNFSLMWLSIGLASINAYGVYKWQK